MRLAIHWPMDFAGTEPGNMLGYASSSVAIRRELGRFVDLSPDAAIAVHYCNAELYRPIPGKVNLLFTMWESDALPSAYLKAFADPLTVGVITPSTYCRDVFRKAYKGAIEVVPLGVDLGAFQRVKRHWDPRDGKPFRWLYVGAFNQRKYSILGQVFAALYSAVGPMVELTFKTTGFDPREAVRQLREHGFDLEAHGGVMRGPGGTLDTRMLSTADLAQLYADHHAFFALSIGEGWSLAPLEAMATGMPVVATAYSGPLDYLNRGNSYLVKAHRGVVAGELQGGGKCEVIEGALPDLEDAIRQSTAVMTNYRKALRVGKLAADTAQRYSWEASARSLVRAIRNLATRHTSIAA